MNQFNHRQKQWLAKFIQQFRESVLTSETFIPNTSLQKAFTEIPLHPKYIQLSFFIGTLRSFLWRTYPGKKTENWFWDYRKQHVFCEHPAVHHLEQQLFPWDGLKSALSFASCKLMRSGKTEYLFSGLIKRSVYNAGSVTKLPFLKIKVSLKFYMQCHHLSAVTDNLHCVSKKQ